MTSLRRNPQLYQPTESVCSPRCGACRNHWLPRIMPQHPFPLNGHVVILYWIRASLSGHIIAGSCGHFLQISQQTTATKNLPVLTAIILYLARPWSINDSHTSKLTLLPDFFNNYKNWLFLRNVLSCCNNLVPIIQLKWILEIWNIFLSSASTKFLETVVKWPRTCFKNAASNISLQYQP